MKNRSLEATTATLTTSVFEFCKNLLLLANFAACSLEGCQQRIVVTLVDGSGHRLGLVVNEFARAGKAEYGPSVSAIWQQFEAIEVKVAHTVIISSASWHANQFQTRADSVSECLTAPFWSGIAAHLVKRNAAKY